VADVGFAKRTRILVVLGIALGLPILTVATACRVINLDFSMPPSHVLSEVNEALLGLRVAAGAAGLIALCLGRDRPGDV